MLSLLRLLWLLLMAETVPDDTPDEPDDDEPDPDEPANEPEPSKTHDPDARIRSLVGANDRLAKRNKKLQKALAEAEGHQVTSDGMLELQRENAFLRAVFEKGETLDMDTAWDLLHVRGFIDTVTVDDDGQVTGMPDALDRLLDRYPWLSDEVPETVDEDPNRPRRTAMPPKKRQGSPDGPSKTQLEDRFPSLRRRG